VDLKDMSCDDGWWIKLAQNRVQWRYLILAVLYFRLTNKVNLMEMGYDDGR
jgi:hypothetical protein